MKSAFSATKTISLALFFVASVAFGAKPKEATAAADTTDLAEVVEQEDGKEFDAGAVILAHVMDDHQWHLTDHLVIPLPIIVYSAEKGLDVFSSAHLYEHHKPVEYNGYILKHHKIHLVDGGKEVLDLSITKNVAMLLINAVLLVVVFFAVAKAYRQNKGKAPSGLQSFIEPIIIFVRDEIVKPNIGHGYEKYFPYLLTLFFFVLFGNFLGLLPGSGNMTGNIAVTLVLAVLTFLITNLSGNASYWKHIFWTPGVPLPLRLVILPVEVIGIFTKPFSLTIRLFVAITAGHIVILSLIALAFIFGSYTVGLVSSLVAVFINVIELLVAGIQAYVFTLFTSLYIGMATAEDDHH